MNGRRDIAALLTLWAFLAHTFVLFPAYGVTAFNRNLNGLGLSSSSFRSNGFGLGLIDAQGKVNLTAGVPQTTPNNSRVLAVNANNVGNNFEINRRVFISDARSGLANLQLRVEIDGSKQVRFANARGDRFGDFVNGVLDSQAEKEADKFILENLVGKVINNIEKRIIGFNNQDLADILTAVNLARRMLGPKLSAGVATIQCPQQNILKTAVNYGAGDKVDRVWGEKSDVDLCIKQVSDALNHVKPTGKPPVIVNKSMYKDGVLTVPNLLRTFSLPALGVLFNPANNTNVCNHERRSGDLMTYVDDLVSSVMDGGIYNLVKGYDLEDGNRNLFLEGFGVNAAVSRQLMGPLGVAAGVFASNLTDIAFVDGRESGVAKSGLNREIRAWANAVGRVFFTFDTNAEKSGIQLQAQNVRQTGRNNLGYAQGEWWRMDRWGSIDWGLTASPDADGKMAVATEVPATAAHFAAIKVGSTSAAVIAGQCIACHVYGTKSIDGQQQFTPLAVNGTNGVQKLSANFSNALAQYRNFKKLIGTWDTDENGRSRSILFETYQKIKQRKSIDYAANTVGLSGNQLRGMMAKDRSLVTKLQVDKDGNVDNQNWTAAKCAIKFELAGRKGGKVSNGAQISTVGPLGHYAEAGKGAAQGGESGASEVAKVDEEGSPKTVSDSPNQSDTPHA